MNFREATAEDLATVRAFIFEHGVNEWNYLCEDELDRHLAGIATGDTICLIAEEDRLLIGIATCGTSTSFGRYESKQLPAALHASISEVVVARHQCGQGIGTRLLNECKKRLGAFGVESIYVERHEDNAASAGMMRKAGFELIDTFFDPDRRSTGSRKTAVCRFLF